MSGTIAYTVASESQLNAAMAAINSASPGAPANTDYLILLTTDITLAYPRSPPSRWRRPTC